jgi:hypothetical protein
MLKRTIQSRMLVVFFVVTTLMSAPLSALGQKSSPVAPSRVQAQAVGREACDKFKDEARRKVRAWEAAHLTGKTRISLAPVTTGESLEGRHEPI